MLDCKSLTHRGLVREHNEDSYAEDLAHGLWVVADGVGGNGHGEIASQMAVQSIERQLRQGAPVDDAIEKANDVLTEVIEQNPEYTHMATTVVACKFEAGHYELSWVGDSRAYLINSAGIEQLTSDHNMANALVEQGALSREQGESHKGQHELTQALGQLSLDRLPKNIGELHDGDYLLLCTDGLSGVVEEGVIRELVLNSPTLEEAVDQLLEKVLAAGAPDNVTYSLIRYQQDDQEIHRRDFSAKGNRLPFDRRPYEENCKRRPTFLLVILLSLIFIFFML